MAVNKRTSQPDLPGVGRHRKLHSVSEEAERLGISKGFLYTEIREGRFPHIKLGDRVLLPRGGRSVH